MIDTRIALATLALVASTPAYANVAISTDPTSNMNCTGGVCAPTATDAVLNVTDLENLLASGNVSVATTNGSIQANNIDITAAFSWSTGSALTLDAYQSLTVNASISVQGLAGLNIRTNDGGQNGTFRFGAGSSVTFANLTSSLSINGLSYTLVDSLPSLASAVAANPSGTYALADSYDAKQDGRYSQSPVSTTLGGTFEGLGHQIENLKIDYDNDLQLLDTGLFSQTGTSGVVRDVGVTNVMIKVRTLNFAYVGALVGVNDGTILNTFATGSVENKDDEITGGLVAANYGTTAGSYADVHVHVGQYQTAGGLVGYNDGTITTSFATGDVGGGGGDSNSGGLVGFSNGDVENCFATGSVTGNGAHHIGGLIGVINNESATNQSSYSTGAVPNKETRNYITGGAIGANDNKIITAFYWDTTTSGTDVGVGFGKSKGVSPLTTAQLQSGLPAGFDPSIWAEDANINNGFPYLISNPPPN